MIETPRCVSWCHSCPGPWIMRSRSDGACDGACVRVGATEVLLIVATPLKDLRQPEAGDVGSNHQ